MRCDDDEDPQLGRSSIVDLLTSDRLKGTVRIENRFAGKILRQFMKNILLKVVYSTVNVRKKLGWQAQLSLGV